MEPEPSLSLHELPEEVKVLFEKIAVPPYLLAHLIVVHDVATRLVSAIQRRWPELSFDAEAVRFGAATHDVGKVLHPNEMFAPGEAHREAGAKLLRQHGVSAARARFARTHAEWASVRNVQLEDLLVAMADKTWKGGRDERLENAFLAAIGQTVGDERWEAYMVLDELLTRLGEDAERRLLWQSQFLPDRTQQAISERWSEHQSAGD